MNLTKKIAFGLIVTGLSALMLSGCSGKIDTYSQSNQRSSKPKTEEQKVKVPEVRNYFGVLTLPLNNPIVTRGDFDNDGDLDLIVTQVCREENDIPLRTRLYLFENDGKGNFTLRTYSDK
jgi:hypothetical protein